MQVAQLRAARATFVPPPRFTEVVDLIKTGHFGWQDYFAPLMDTLETTDHYLVANDFQGYIDIQARRHALARCRCPTLCCMLELRSPFSGTLPAGIPGHVCTALCCWGPSWRLQVCAACASEPSSMLWRALGV